MAKLKYSRETYLSFDRFCATVVENVKKAIKRNAATEKIIAVLTIIALILFHVGVIAFLAIWVLLFAGMVVWYGSISALFAAHPVLTTVFISVSAGTGLSLFASVKVMFERRDVFDIVRREIIDKYKPLFTESLRENGSSNESISESHEKCVNQLVRKAEADFIAALIDRTSLNISDFFMNVLKQITMSDIEDIENEFR